MQLSRILLTVAISSLLTAAGCTLDGVGSRSDAIQSCYDTGYSIQCVDTPGGVQTALADVDGDGREDTFVCGDGVSESDSDLDGTDSDTSSEEDATGDDEVVAIAEDAEDDDLDADSESDSESASESDDPCAASDEASDDDSISDEEGDGDADGVADADDCDCIAQTDPVVVQ